MEPRSLLPDEPITSPEEDLLGHMRVAEIIAQALLDRPGAKGMVLAVCGTWGTGKTSCLNLIEHCLRHQAADFVVVRINPWWFSDGEGLFRHFLGQLAIAASSNQHGLNQLARRFAEFITTFSDLPGSAGTVAQTVSRILRFITQQANTAWKAKQCLADALAKQGRRLVVMVDDIDRLRPEEIRQVLGLVRVIADLPKVDYLLAFDRDVVVKACGEPQAAGEQYLAKIVQYWYDLSLARVPLRNLFWSHIDGLLQDTPPCLLSRAELGNVYWEAVDHFLGTPRNVKRLCNGLSLRYPRLVGEVNAADFLAIEGIRTFAPGLHGWLAAQGQLVAGSTDREPQLTKEEVQTMLAQVPDEQSAMLARLLRRMFPRVDHVLGGNAWPMEWERVWRRNRRICSPEVLERFFSSSLPPEDISSTDLGRLVEGNDAETLGKALIAFSQQRTVGGRTRVASVLEEMDLLVDDLPPQSVDIWLQGLFLVGDELILPDDETGGFWQRGNADRLRILVVRLLRRLPSEYRFIVLEAFLRKSRAVSLAVDIVSLMGLEHGRLGRRPIAEGERLVSTGQLEQLEANAATLIADKARDGALLHTPHLDHTLYRWRDWSGVEKPREWVRDLLMRGTSEDAVSLIIAFASTRSAFNVGDLVSDATLRFDIDGLGSFTDIGSLHNICFLVLTSSPDWLSPDVRSALNVFISSPPPGAASSASDQEPQRPDP